MKKMNQVLTREDLMKELEELYEKKTREGMECLQKLGDSCAPMITVIDVRRNEYEIPFDDPYASSEEEVKEEVAAKVKKILKKKGGLAVISIGDGWRKNLRDQSKAVEVFYAIIESMVMKKMKVWKIKRNETGERIFPLGEPESISKDIPFSRYTGKYFSVS